MPVVVFVSTSEYRELWGSGMPTQPTPPAKQQVSPPAPAAAPKPDKPAKPVSTDARKAYYALDKDARKAYREKVGGDWSKGYDGRFPNGEAKVEKPQVKTDTRDYTYSAAQHAAYEAHNRKKFSSQSAYMKAVNADARELVALAQ